MFFKIDVPNWVVTVHTNVIQSVQSSKTVNGILVYMYTVEAKSRVDDEWCG